MQLAVRCTQIRFVLVRALAACTVYRTQYIVFCFILSRWHDAICSFYCYKLCAQQSRGKSIDNWTSTTNDKKPRDSHVRISIWSIRIALFSFVFVRGILLLSGIFLLNFSTATRYYYCDWVALILSGCKSLNQYSLNLWDVIVFILALVAGKIYCLMHIILLLFILILVATCPQVGLSRYLLSLVTT